ncbi:MAG: thiamine pyrophosphate-binding protein [Promicromonosporaceae bacterium]|nr:thiamine pyrophosphate-binding protein [Promicromonosporaceae bacterium]
MSAAVSNARALVAELVRAGVRHFVISPGSRSAPLAYAVGEAAARDELTLHVRLDERGAGFFAVGLAKRLSHPDNLVSERPCGTLVSPTTTVAVICTSGTAVANLHPAVLEADLARLPLLLLTADRPAEQQGVLASQTVDQLGIFGTAVRGLLPLEAPENNLADTSEAANVSDLDTARKTAREALILATNPENPGPVQVNLRYREPLHPSDLDSQHAPTEFMQCAVVEPVETTAPEVSRFFESRISRCSEPEASPPSDRSGDPFLPGDPTRTVVIAGDGAGPLAAALAHAQGWPLLAEPSSGSFGNGIVGYRMLLPLVGKPCQPLHAVVVGRPTLNRAVNALLSDPKVAVTVVAPGSPPWPDAWRNTARFLRGLAPRWFEPAVEAPSAFAQTWSRASDIAAEVFRCAATELTGRLGYLAAAREVLNAQVESGPLVVGASNVIRDLDLLGGALDCDESRFARGSARVPLGPILANRGVAGIDGTIATALGIASADQASTRSTGPARLFLGDLAFFHDANSLLTGVLEQRPQLQIVVANDAGGSIFSTLEHGAWAAGDPSRERLFQRVFTTPQQGDIAALCAGFDVGYRRVRSRSDLKAVLRDPGLGVEVVEITLDASGRLAATRQLALAIAGELNGN